LPRGASACLICCPAGSARAAQERAEQLRLAKISEKQSRLRVANSKVAEVSSRAAQELAKRHHETEERHHKAEEVHTEYLRAVRSRATSQNQKVHEIAFIQSLT
jgi:hypothetical protein